MVLLSLLLLIYDKALYLNELNALLSVQYISFSLHRILSVEGTLHCIASHSTRDLVTTVLLYHSFVTLNKDPPASDCQRSCRPNHK